MQSIYTLNFTFVLIYFLTKIQKQYSESKDLKKKHHILSLGILLIISSIPIYIFAENIMNYLASIAMNFMLSLFPVVPGIR
jgi:hypothetical protein